ncbi:MAG: hypothetical protein ACI9DJ_003031, partial [Algoriphagus sp.]
KRLGTSSGESYNIKVLNSSLKKSVLVGFFV